MLDRLREIVFHHGTEPDSERSTKAQRLDVLAAENDRTGRRIRAIAAELRAEARVKAYSRVRLGPRR